MTKNNLSYELRQFAQFRDSNNEIYTEQVAEEIFNDTKIKNIFAHGLTYKFYNTYGIEELDFVYSNIKQKEFSNRVKEYTKKLFIKNFKTSQVKILDLDNSTTATAYKIVIAFINFSQREAIRNVVINEAKERFPELTSHYLVKYTKMRKFGIELKDYNAHVGADVEKLFEILKENNMNLSISNIYGMFMAFGYLTREEAKKYKSYYHKHLHCANKEDLKFDNNVFYSSCLFTIIDDEIYNPVTNKPNVNKEIRQKAREIQKEKGLTSHYKKMLEDILSFGFTLYSDDDILINIVGISPVSLKKLRAKMA